MRALVIFINQYIIRDYERFVRMVRAQVCVVEGCGSEADECEGGDYCAL